ncbi:hypothetical protein L6164_012696 [Bauhinia variegata]|uniref:Uncharacterized protein n=1 Tax=Bauhinia variegata TaxID=167791 RepID=A0ACB9PG38_BAUVA|nr:hypothetical protein L6164_012696 [Bauhinia variegata]
MANFTPSSSATAPFHADILPFTAASPSAALDDGSEDSCSICLDPFSTDEPATVTSCKHEYHLHCILEWSQRSKECPICWQLLVLKDPGSQKLVAAVEDEEHLRSRSTNLSTSTNSRSSLERRNADHIMQRLVAAARRARFFRRRERQRSSGAGPSDNSPSNVSAVQPRLTTSPSVSSAPTSGVTSAGDIQHSPSVFSLGVEAAARNTTSENDAPFRPRVLYRQSRSQSVRRPNASDVLSLPESIKCKFSAASAKYKESITKNTRGLKEKLIARSPSVKELSKGVQREMNAGIAGVAKMIERLDLTSKRSSASALIPSFSQKGMRGENGIGESISKESGAVARNVNSDSPSPVSSLIRSSS